MLDRAALKKQIEERSLSTPIALLDRSAYKNNLDLLFQHFPYKNKVRIRLATKSVRCPALIKDFLEVDSDRKAIAGLMAYRVDEARYLVEKLGADDVLVAYPIYSPVEARLLASLQKKRRATVSIVVDCKEQVDLIAKETSTANVEAPLVLDLNLAYRPLSKRDFQLGARRSPLASGAAVRQLAEYIRASDGVRVHGVMGYEAHHSAVPDRPQERLFKRISRPSIEQLRSEVGESLAAAGFKDLPLLNGGGSGTYVTTSKSNWVNEVAVGSALYKSALFDKHAELKKFQPSLYFALQVVRQPGPKWATAHGGGYYASGGGASAVLAQPRNLKITSQEGFGEVQTPIRDPAQQLQLGDLVLCRAAKAGEPLERFNEIFPFEEGRLMDALSTYRGEGLNFG